MLHEELTIFDFSYILLLITICLAIYIGWREGYLNGYEDGRRRHPPRIQSTSLKNRIRRFKMRGRR